MFSQIDRELGRKGRRKWVGENSERWVQNTEPMSHAGCCLLLPHPPVTRKDEKAKFIEREAL